MHEIMGDFYEAVVPHVQNPNWLSKMIVRQLIKKELELPRS